MPEQPIAKKRGNRAGIWFFKMALRLSGLRGAYGLLHPVCAYYAWFDRAACRSAAAYLRRRFPGRGRARLRRDVFRLFLEQGKNLVDRHAMVAGAVRFDIDIRGYEKIEPLVAAGEGFILLTSHTGNWQAAMAALGKLGRTVHLLMRPEDNAAVREAVRVDAEGGGVRTISPGQHFGGVVEIMKALEQGGIVGIMGDRTYGADGVAVDFLGAPARFPYSAFQVAAAAGRPVVVMLSSKTGPQAYEVEIAEVLRPVADRRRGDRKEQLRGWVQRYAAILEAFVRRHPYQYFVFHDVWGETP